MTGLTGVPERLAFERILITGSSGFVGRYLAPELAGRLNAGARIFLADRQAATRPPPRGVVCESLTLDITDEDAVRRAMETVRPDLVVHLAGQAMTGLGPGHNQATWALNFGGTFSLARAVAAFAPDCTFFNASSAEVYGRAFNKGPVGEETPLEPTSAYAHSKAAAEWMLADVLPASSRLIVMRPSNHVGAGQTPNFVLPAFAEQIANIERIGGGELRVGNLEAKRDFMHVRDVARAYADVMACAQRMPSRNVFNVASGVVIKVSAILEALLELSTVQVDVVVDPGRWRPAEAPVAAVDARRLRDEIGWRARHSVDDAIREVLDELRDVQRDPTTDERRN